MTRPPRSSEASSPGSQYELLLDDIYLDNPGPTQSQHEIPLTPSQLRKALDWQEREARRLEERLSSIPFYGNQARKEGSVYWRRLAGIYYEHLASLNR